MIDFAEIIEKGISYSQYKDSAQNILSTGVLSEKLSGFTKLNLHRMERIEKTIEVEESVKNVLSDVPYSFLWLVLAESWCGDCAQNLPVISKIADISGGRIQLKIFIREEHPELMNAYLTNGAMSIPKLICLRADSLKVMGVWGPRPKPAQNIFANYKQNPEGRTWDDYENELHLWYARDKSKTLQAEFSAAIIDWNRRDELAFERYSE
jgi:hypothetical protein